MSPSKLLIIAAALTIVFASPDLSAQTAEGGGPPESAPLPETAAAPQAEAPVQAEDAAPAAEAPDPSPADEAELSATDPVQEPAGAGPPEPAADAPGALAETPERLPVQPDPSEQPEEAVEASLASADAAEPTQAPTQDQGDLLPSEPQSTDETAAAAPLLGTAAPPHGAVGYDSQGREGRIHLVVRGDTLWDISDAYLGTPWVWPSIWQDNGEIENPHLIYPGDRIWITPFEMRRVTLKEAEALLAGTPADLDPAAPEASEPGTGFEPVPAALSDATPSMRTLRVSARESAGLVSPEQLAASASVVGKVPERVLLSQEDELYIGLGEADVEKGDQFTVFRTREKVYDPDTGDLLGYHVQIVGWVEVEETYPETSLASVRMSTSGIALEDRLMPREPLPQEIRLQPSPEGVEGKISFFPDRRVLMGFNDFVYLNRGSLDGLEVGSPLEVYREGYGANEVTRHEMVDVPDRVVAQMVVVRAAGEAAVAVVTRTDTELRLGDRFRAAQ